MSSDGQSQTGAQQQQSRPYAPRNASLGGRPAIIPDIPLTAVFLFLYIIFAATHQKILINNKARKHKFNISGALFGLCMVRLVTMSLRIAWACYPGNVSLGISAQVFVYVGTIILYVVNWFFAQRVVRAQHPRFGWSTSYRMLHRLGILGLILCLFMLIVGAIQQFFTLDAHTLRVDHALQLTGQTYFALFCFAPIILVTLSLILPRHGTEKFGAGRLRNNIAILLAATTILSAGQIFRVVLAWLPETPLRDAQDQPVDIPWYYSKACFYAFNFTTELVVVVAYAAVRVDLRFHIPDGSKKAGDYTSKRDSKYNVYIIGDEKNLKRRPTRSNETLQASEGSLFDDSQTLANSLRYPSTYLEVDPKTGRWKIKRVSQGTPMYSLGNSHWDPTAPPIPDCDWPLREIQISHDQDLVVEHRNRSSILPANSSTTKLHNMSAVTLGRAAAAADAADEALRKLETNSKTGKPPPTYRSFESSMCSHDPSLKRSYSSSSELPKKHVYMASSHAESSPLKPYDRGANFTTSSAHTGGPETKKEYLRYEPSLDRSRPSSASQRDTSIDAEATDGECVRFGSETSLQTGNLSASEKRLEGS